MCADSSTKAKRLNILKMVEKGWIQWKQLKTVEQIKNDQKRLKTKGVGVANKSLGTEHVISGPMRGLKQTF